MSIDVHWEVMDYESEGPGPAGTRVLETVRDDHSLVERFLTNLKGDLPYLRFIGHDTLTVFHQDHLLQLADELDQLSAQDHEPEVAKQLRAVSNLVRGAYGIKDSLIAFRGRKLDA